jgi:DNA-binding FadR family transcriptional regulator
MTWFIGGVLVLVVALGGLWLYKHNSKDYAVNPDTSVLRKKVFDQVGALMDAIERKDYSAAHQAYSSLYGLYSDIPDSASWKKDIYRRLTDLYDKLLALR